MSELSASRISKRYGKRQVVENVSLSVSTGEVVGLLGPNGAGKTTCFYCIVGIVKMDAGSISIDDFDASNSPMHIRARRGLGYLPQEASVFRRLSTYKNILAIVELQRGLKPTGTVRENERPYGRIRPTERQRYLGRTSLWRRSGEGLR